MSLLIFNLFNSPSIGSLVLCQGQTRGMTSSLSRPVATEARPCVYAALQMSVRGIIAYPDP